MNLLQNARAYIAAAATAATALNVAAEEAHWIGMGSDDNWSNIQNWRFSADGTSPAGCDLVFGAEDRVTETKINNIVDASITIGSITYTNSNRFPSPPTGNNFQYVYHVTQINAGQTLTVDGNTTNVDAFRIGGNFGTSKHFIPAKITGPGTFTVNAPTKSFRLFVTPSAATGGTILDVTGVANFNVNVSNIWCGGSLPAHSGALLLPTGAGSQSTLCAKSVYVNGSSEEAANSRIIFGASTTLFTDFLGVNVPPPVSGLTDKGGGVGTLDFATGAAATHSLVIRGFSGEPDSRTEMRVASAMNTPDVPYFQSAHVYWTNGFVDAKFSSLIITEGRGHKWSKETGGQRTDFFFANGTIDAETIVIGRALVNNTGGALSALPAIGAFNILGGNILAGSMILGDAVPLSKGQSAVGMLKVANNASVTVSDDLVTGNRQGTGNACTSIIEVVGGTLNVAGNIAPGAFVAQTVSQITLSGGEVQVPNGELRIETGTLTLDGGQAQINTLVLTNEAAEVAVNLKQDSEPGLITATHTQLGGILTVNDATDYSTKSPLKKWTILRGPHTGTFQTLNLPERMQVLYTADSVDILYPGHATQITIF